MTLTCLVAMAKPYKENYKFRNTTDTVLMLLLTMVYGLLVSGSIVNTTAGSYYFKGIYNIGSETSYSRITYVEIAIMVLRWLCSKRMCGQSDQGEHVKDSLVDRLIVPRNYVTS